MTEARTVDVGGNQGRGNPPRARAPITLASDEGTLAESIPEVNVMARCAQIACLVFAFGCAAAGIHAYFFR